MNVKISYWYVDPRPYLATPVNAVVNGGKLPSFAVTSVEKAFFVSNNATALATPTLVIGDNTGYNSANFLLCLS